MVITAIVEAANAEAKMQRGAKILAPPPDTPMRSAMLSSTVVLLIVPLHISLLGQGKALLLT